MSTAYGREITRSPRTWHFRFYEVRDVPEMLSPERSGSFCLGSTVAVNARAFTNEVEDIYARTYSTQERCGQGSITIEHSPRT